MPTSNPPPKQLLAEIDNLVGLGNFASKVRAFHGHQIDKGELDDNDDSEEAANKYVGKFKKYLKRLKDNPNEKSKPYRELLSFRDFLKGTERAPTIESPFPLPDNVRDAIRKLSRKIFDDVNMR
ncbi:MAG: hypothetical protein J6Y56_01355 [Fibrobacterales bacterium]|nr:hypothetical protein [Fibrobacterales bacterium]